MRIVIRVAHVLHACPVWKALRCVSFSAKSVMYFRLAEGQCERTAAAGTPAAAYAVGGLPCRAASCMRLPDGRPVLLWRIMLPARYGALPPNQTEDNSGPVSTCSVLFGPSRSMSGGMAQAVLWGRLEIIGFGLYRTRNYICCHFLMQTV